MQAKQRIFVGIFVKLFNKIFINNAKNIYLKNTVRGLYNMKAFLLEGKASINKMKGFKLVLTLKLASA